MSGPQANELFAGMKGGERMFLLLSPLIPAQAGIQLWAPLARGRAPSGSRRRLRQPVHLALYELTIGAVAA
jgi:hypothetical protein